MKVSLIETEDYHQHDMLAYLETDKDTVVFQRRGVDNGELSENFYRNCQARVQVPNPLSQQVQNPDSKVRPSLKNPKTQFFGLGLTQ